MAKIQLIYDIDNCSRCPLHRTQPLITSENTGDLKKEMAALNTILPIKLKNNLDKAYEVYLLLKEKEGD